MCSPATQDLIKRVVNGRIKRKEPFSAWEVTLEVRKEFGITPSQERHDDMKKVVHELFENSEMTGYKRSLHNYGGPIPAYRYEPDGTANVQTQPAIGTTDAQTQPISGGYQPSSNAVVSTHTPSTVTKSIDATADTIYVPGPQVRRLGLDIGDLAYVHADNGLIRVSDTPFVGSNNEIHVDLRGNLRVHTSYLTAAGINSRNLKIEFQDAGDAHGTPYGAQIHITEN